MAVSLGELAVRFGCELHGDPDQRVEHVATLGGADEHALAFVANPRYRSQLAATRAAAVVLGRDSMQGCPTAMLVCENPHATYARIAALLHPPPPLAPGIHPTAVVAGSARIDPSAEIGPYATLGADVVVGPRCLVGPHCVLDAGVRLAADVRLVARVTLCRAVEIGARTLLQPGVVVGADGFGYATDKSGWVKVPQVGTVRIGADVEIGANTTIDRGAIGDTVIEEGVKLDNLIQVAHNVRIGAHSAVAACAGISGSATIGKRCMIGGGAGIAGHLSIADDVTITGYSAVTHSVTSAGVYSGTLPSEEVRTWRRLVARFKRSALIEARLRKLERAAGLAPAQDDDEHE